MSDDVDEKKYRTIVINCEDCRGTGAWNNPDNSCPSCDGNGYFAKDVRCSDKNIKRYYPAWELWEQ